MKKRISVNGHYRLVEWGEDGRFLSVKKWSPRMSQVATDSAMSESTNKADQDEGVQGV